MEDRNADNLRTLLWFMFQHNAGPGDFAERCRKFNKSYNKKERETEEGTDYNERLL